MSATVYTTAGGRRFHFARACRALAAGREIQAYRAGETWLPGAGSTSGLYPLRTRSNTGAALLGYTACRVCTPPEYALPLVHGDYGHWPVTGTGWSGGPVVFCRRCTTRVRRSVWHEDDAVPERWTELRPVLWPCMSAAVLGLVVIDADRWNARYPVGTPVHAWPGTRAAEPLRVRTRTPAWTLGGGSAVVSVDGYAGGIALTHVDPL